MVLLVIVVYSCSRKDFLSSLSLSPFHVVVACVPRVKSMVIPNQSVNRRIFLFLFLFFSFLCDVTSSRTGRGEGFGFLRRALVADELVRGSDSLFLPPPPPFSPSFLSFFFIFELRE